MAPRRPARSGGRGVTKTKKKTLLILNGPAYGTERSYNGFRLAGALAERDDCDVRVFLVGDAVTCAMTGQKVPNGYYLDRMLESAARDGADIGCCGTCRDTRGIDHDHFAKGAHRSTLDELADWTVWADKVVTFQPREPSWPITPLSCSPPNT